VPKNFLVGSFADEHSLLKAAQAARERGFRIYDVFTPYPVHGLETVLRIRKSRLPWITLLGGVSGLLLSIGFQFYGAILDWPMNVGGKPDNSTLAFVPITFEIAVLAAGLVTAAALLVRTRLFPGAHEQLFAQGVTDDTFAIALRQRESTDSQLLQRVLMEHGASEVYEREAKL
jgi:hypothetical protein